MNRAMVLTLLSMAASVAAAVAAPEVDAAPQVACADKAITAQSVVLNLTPSARIGSTEAARALCAGESAERYLRWHHGSMKLMPICDVAAHT
jgi:hypothetical protein